MSGGSNSDTDRLFWFIIFILVAVFVGLIFSIATQNQRNIADELKTVTTVTGRITHLFPFETHHYGVGVYKDDGQLELFEIRSTYAFPQRVDELFLQLKVGDQYTFNVLGTQDKSSSRVIYGVVAKVVQPTDQPGMPVPPTPQSKS